MTLFPLTEDQCNGALIALVIAVPSVGFIALQAAKLWGPAFAWTFVGVTGALLGFIGFQVVRSRKSNFRNEQAADV